MSPTVLRRSAAATIAALGLAVLLSGCSPVAGITPGRDTTTTGSAPAPTRENVSISADGFMPDWIDGLTIVRNTSEDPDCPWSTAYPKIPNAGALTRTLRAEVKEYLVTVRKGGLGPDRDECTEPAGSAGLQIGFDFLIASADVVGVRLTFDDAFNYVFTRTYWYDANTGRVLPPRSLLARSTMPSAVDGIIDDLSRRPGADRSFAQAALSRQYRNDTLQDLSFDSQGALHLRFTRGEVAPADAGPQEVIIPREEATGWLSGLGLRAQEQAIHPEHRLSLAAAPAQTPDPTSPETPQPSATTAPESDTEAGVDCTAVKCIALTFDDGPGPFTAELLAELQKHSARATFFVLGQDVVANPDLVRAELAAGHEIGNHSWSHPQLTRLSAGQIAQQLTDTDTAVQHATGQTPTLFRPPYGLINGTVRQQADRPVILWNRDTEDWKVRNAKKVAANVIATAHPGDIVLMHDIHHSTVQAVPAILSNLSRRGYHFVTVSQLLGNRPLTPGRSYFSNPRITDPH